MRTKIVKTASSKTTKAKTTKKVTKKATKKYELGGMTGMGMNSKECDPGDGKKGKNCQTVKKEGVIKRWIRNAKNRNLSNFSKPKFKRTKY
jgi:hypothetical protein